MFRLQLSAIPGEIAALARAADNCSLSVFRVRGTKQPHVLLGIEALKCELTVHFSGLKLLKWKVVLPRALFSPGPITYLHWETRLNQFGDDVKQGGIGNHDP